MNGSYRNGVGVAVAAALLLSAGCRGDAENGSEMPTQDIKTVMEAHVDDLMALEGVTAVAIGALDDGTPCIRVYIVEETEELAARIPKALEGHPVDVEVSGPIEPMGGGGD